jgi:hypothetical protein
MALSKDSPSSTPQGITIRNQFVDLAGSTVLTRNGYELRIWCSGNFGAAFASTLAIDVTSRTIDADGKEHPSDDLLPFTNVLTQVGAIPLMNGFLDFVSVQWNHAVVAPYGVVYVRVDLAVRGSYVLGTLLAGYVATGIPLTFNGSQNLISPLTAVGTPKAIVSAGGNGTSGVQVFANPGVGRFRLQAIQYQITFAATVQFRNLVLLIDIADDTSILLDVFTHVLTVDPQASGGIIVHFGPYERSRAFVKAGVDSEYHYIPMPQFVLENNLPLRFQISTNFTGNVGDAWNANAVYERWVA